MMVTEKKQSQIVQQSSSFFREFVFIVFDQQRTIIFTFCLVCIPILLLALFLPPVYKASAKFSIEIPLQMDPLQKGNYFDYKNRMMRYLQDQKELIFSNRVIQRASEALYPAVGAPEILKKQDEMRKNLEVTPPGGGTFEESNVFYISYQAKDAKVVAEVAKILSQAYLDAFREVSKGKTDSSYDFFKEQTERLAQDMREKEQKLRQYETDQALALIEILNLESGKANIEVGPNVLLTQSRRKHFDLQEELVGVSIAIETLEKELRENKIPVVMPEMEVSGRAITAFKNKVAQLQIQLNEMRPQFSEQFAPLKQVEKELDLNVKSLKEELQRTVQAHKMNKQSIEAKLVGLDSVIQRLQAQIRDSAMEKASYEHLKQEFTLAKDAYTITRGQMEQAKLANSLNQEKQYVTMLDEPQVPARPVSPNRPLLMAIGIIAGLMSGIAIAMLLDHMDNTIKKPEDIERHFDLTTLGSISKIG